ncbi:MAG: hypothetical protein FWD06_07875 [Oscillospiraceae bacterium]|nr:hypothetical protein [Oscillospiraceae bacterium]
MKKYRKAMKEYIAKLNQYPDFAADAMAMNFAWQSHDAEVLAKLNADFNVSSIAIGETDVEKAMALMAHVQKELFCVGEQISPQDNTYAIMSARKTGALFCNYHATVLADMLLSIGIAAMKVACTPKDFDCDRHVAVVAYMRELQKWVFFDPTFNTYFFDQENMPLSVFEIREQYKTSKPVSFKPIEINKQWALVMSGLVCETYDEWYRIYMAKNSFRFKFQDELVVNPIGYNTKNEYDA